LAVFFQVIENYCPEQFRYVDVEELIHFADVVLRAEKGRAFVV